MKNFLFVMTHPGSGWQALSDTLNQLPHVEVFNTGFDYHHPDDLRMLTRNVHKRDNSVAVWGDILLHNQNFTCEALCDCCQFIYWSAPFDPNHPEWKPYGVYASTYYQYRLAGLVEYHRKTGGLWNPNPVELSL